MIKAILVILGLALLGAIALVWLIGAGVNKWADFLSGEGGESRK